jgi:predicted secreted protein
MITKFVPALYISIGATRAMFTLRETFEVPDKNYGTVNRRISSYHHFNLATTPDEAYQKAVDYSETYGIRLITTRESLEAELREISRSAPGEISKAEQLRLKKEAEAAEAERLFFAYLNDTLSQGKYPIGCYSGLEFDQAPRSYITWLITSKDTFSEGTPIKLVAEAVAAKPELLELVLPDTKNSQYLGKVGDKPTYDLIVLRCHYFDGYYGRTYITIMTDKDGNCVVVKSSAFSANEGEELKLKGTIKEHAEYKGVKQTIMQRVKVLK